MTRTSQTNYELNIFNKFKACFNSNLFVDLHSVKNAPPPKPDIICKFKNNKTIGFEIVQSIDKRLKSNLNKSIALSQKIILTFKKLPSSTQEIINNKFKNSEIHIILYENATNNKIISSFSEIFSWLINEGDFCCSNRISSTIIKKIKIIHSTINGPLFTFSSCTSYRDPILNSIQEKFNKTYDFDNKIFLLVFYSQEFNCSNDIDIPKVDEFIKRNIQNSQFSGIYIFSEAQNSIIYNYVIDL